MLCLFLPKGWRKPPHEMLSMKLPAELFRGQEKQEQKRQATVFLLAGSGANAPFLATAVAKAFRRNRRTDLTFTIVKYSKLYFDAVYQGRKYGRENINKETGEIQN